MTDDEYPWPRAHDDPLRLGDDWRNNACLYVGHDQTPWSVMARGYKQAADIVVAHIKEYQRDQDFLCTRSCSTTATHSSWL